MPLMHLHVRCHPFSVELLKERHKCRHNQSSHHSRCFVFLFSLSNVAHLSLLQVVARTKATANQHRRCLKANLSEWKRRHCIYLVDMSERLKVAASRTVLDAKCKCNRQRVKGVQHKRRGTNSNSLSWSSKRLVLTCSARASNDSICSNAIPIRTRVGIWSPGQLHSKVRVLHLERSRSDGLSNFDRAGHVCLDRGGIM